MINWTKDERVAALLPQILAHINEWEEFSLEHEAQLDLIRDEYLNDLWRDFRGECFNDFDEWHSQPTVEEFIHGETE
mgnify:CR=1 FL=1|jgi:hypothetical protein